MEIDDFNKYCYKILCDIWGNAHADYQYTLFTAALGYKKLIASRPERLMIMAEVLGEATR